LQKSGAKMQSWNARLRIDKLVIFGEKMKHPLGGENTKYAQRLPSQVNIYNVYFQYPAAQFEARTRRQKRVAGIPCRRSRAFTHLCSFGKALASAAMGSREKRFDDVIVSSKYSRQKWLAVSPAGPCPSKAAKRARSLRLPSRSQTSSESWLGFCGGLAEYPCKLA